MNKLFIRDIVCTAMEGGGFYWATCGDAKLIHADDDVNGWYYELPFNITDEEGKTHQITEEVVKRGIKA